MHVCHLSMKEKECISSYVEWCQVVQVPRAGRGARVAAPGMCSVDRDALRMLRDRLVRGVPADLFKAAGAEHYWLEKVTADF